MLDKCVVERTSGAMRGTDEWGNTTSVENAGRGGERREGKGTEVGEGARGWRKWREMKVKDGNEERKGRWGRRRIRREEEEERRGTFVSSM